MVVGFGFYAGLAFAPLESLSCPEILDLISVPGVEETGTESFCMESKARTWVKPLSQSAETDAPCNIEEDGSPCENDQSTDRLLFSLPSEEEKPIGITLSEAVQECRYLNNVHAQFIQDSGMEFDLISLGEWDAFKGHIAQQGINVRGPYIVLSNEEVIYYDDRLLEWVKWDRYEGGPLSPQNQLKNSDMRFATEQPSVAPVAKPNSFLTDFEEGEGASTDNQDVAFRSDEGDYPPANATVGFRCVLRPIAENEDVELAENSAPQGQLVHILGREPSQVFADRGSSDPSYSPASSYSYSPISSYPPSSSTLPSDLGQILSFGNTDNGNPGSAHQFGNRFAGTSNNGGKGQGQGSSGTRTSTPTVSIEAVNEKGSMMGGAEFEVSLSTAATRTTTVRINLTQASRWFASSELSKRVIFYTGERTKTFSLLPRTDFSFSGSEFRSLASGNLVATLQSGTGYSLDSSNSSATVQMDSSFPDIRVLLPYFSRFDVEEGKSRRITVLAVTQNGVKPRRAFDVRLEADFGNGEASSGDLVFTSQNIRFNPRDFYQGGSNYLSYKSVTIQTRQDTLQETIESVPLVLSHSQTPFVLIVNSRYSNCFEEVFNSNCSNSAVTPLYIHDDDTPSAVHVSPRDLGLMRSGESARYSMVLNKRPRGNVTITYTLTGGGTGARVTPSRLTFTQNNWDSPQYFTYTNGSGGSRAIIRHQARGGGFQEVRVPSVVTSVDNSDQPPKVSLYPVRNRVNEGREDGFNFKVRLSRSAESQISFRYRTKNHRGAAHPATAGTDFDVIDKALVFEAGEREKTLTFSAIEDARLEHDETFELELYNFNSSQVTPITDGVKKILTILNDDMVYLSLSPTQYSVGEGAGSVPITVKLNAAVEKLSSFDVTLYVLSLGGSGSNTARPGQDYEGYKHLVQFNAGEVEKTVNVPIIDDNKKESSENTSLLLSVLPSIRSEGIQLQPGKFRGRLTILDNDSTTVTVSRASIVEGSPLNFKVRLNQASHLSVRVNYATSIASGQSAEPGDFTTRSGTLVFNPGETEKTVSVPTAIDTDTSNEEMTLTLSSPQNASLGHGFKAFGLIYDRMNGDLPKLLGYQKINAQEGNERRGRLQLLSTNVDEAVSCSFSVPETLERLRVRGHTDILTIPAGRNNSNTLELWVNDDDIYNFEGGRKCDDITLSTGAAFIIPDDKKTTEICILDDEEAPTLKITNEAGTHSPTQVAEGGTVTLKISLSHAAGFPIPVPYRTTSGTATRSDYVHKSAKVTFQPGETEKTIEVATVDDEVFEADTETFQVELYNFSTEHVTPYETLSHSIQITNTDETTVSLGPDVTVNEGAGQASVTLTRSDSSASGPITVTISTLTTQNGATEGTTDPPAEGDDFKGIPHNTQVTLNSGQRELIINIPIWEDSLAESSESFLVDLRQSDNTPANVNVGRGTAVVTILDNDTRGIEITPQDLYVETGDTVSYAVVLRSKPTGNVTITPSISNGGTGASITPSRLTFTSSNWDTPQSFTYTAGDGEVATISHAVSGADYGSNSVTASSVSVILDTPDEPPKVSIVLAQPNQNEETGEFEVGVNLSRPAGRQIRVPYRTVAGTAKANVDYYTRSGTLVFNTGDQEKTLRLRLKDDNIVEAVETFTLELYNFNTSHVTAGQTTRVINIVDTDTTTISVSPAELEVNESDGQARFTYSWDAPIDPGLGYQLLVSYLFLVNGREAEEEDLTFTPYTVTFDENLRSPQQISVGIVDDSLAEGNEEFSVYLIHETRSSISSDRVIIEPATNKVTIVDNDERSIQVSPSTVLEVHEGEGVSYQLRTSSSHDGFTMTPSVSSPTAALSSGGDFLWTANVLISSLSFAASSTPSAKTLTVWASEDDDDEDEEFTVTHAISGGEYDGVTAPTVTVRVYDDDGLSITPVAGSQRGEGVESYHSQLDEDTRALGQNTAEGLWLTEGWSQRFNVKVAGSTTTARVVNLLTVGSTVSSGDYSLEVGGRRLNAPYQVTIPAGRESVEVTVKVLRDGNDNEGTETLVLNGTHNGRPLGNLTFNISPCGGSDPKAFAWLSVDGENPLRRHHRLLNGGSVNAISGPDFRLRVCFRDAVRGLSLGNSLSISSGSSGSLSGLSQRVSGQIWTANVTAQSHGTMEIALNLSNLQYADGSQIPAGSYHIDWEPLISMPVVEQTPLTASFSEAPPSEHDGSAFTFRVAFSEPILVIPGEMRNVIEITGGTVTSATSVNGNRDTTLWEIEVTPSGNEDISFTFPVPEGCGVDYLGNLCADDGRPLQSSLQASVEGYEIESPPVDTNVLTASFSDYPSEYTGAFTVRLNFTEAITTSTGNLMKALSTGHYGTIRDLVKVDGRADLWEFTVRLFPRSYNYEADMVISLSSPSSNCNNPKAICTDGGMALSNSPSITVKAPAVVKIADATAREGVDDTIDFQLTLTRPVNHPASIKWYTTDGTAVEGVDFSGKKGVVHFATGDQSAVLSLPLIDDVLDGGEKKFKVLIFKNEGVFTAIDSRENRATGTIINDDPMPRAWLSRFGRTVGSQAVEAISSRMGKTQENRFVLGGVEISSGADNSGGEDLETAALRSQSDYDWLRGNRSSVNGQLGGQSYGLNPVESRSMTMEEVMQGTSFNLGVVNQNTGRTWAIWGQFAQDNFEGREEGLTLQGEVRSGFLGADLKSKNWRGGFAFSQSDSKGTFDFLDLPSRNQCHSGEDGNSGVCQPENGNNIIDNGKVESRLTSFYPYVGYEFGENKAVWGMLGLGEGDMTITQQANEKRTEDRVTKTDISMRMGAVGAKTPLMSQDEGDVLDVIVQTDGMYVRMDSEASNGMEATKAEVTRLRLMLGSSRAFKLGEGVLTPSFQMGVRHDGGDAEEGFGLEAGSALRYEAGRFTLEGSVRRLLAHEDENYEEWGASAALRLDPGRSGRGLSLSIAPTWGQPSENIDNLWSANRAGNLGQGNFEAAQSLEAEIGYGLFKPFAFLRGLVTPYLGVSLLDNNSNRTYRTGTRWIPFPNAQLSLELNRTESDQAEDQAIMFQGGFSW